VVAVSIAVDQTARLYFLRQREMKKLKDEDIRFQVDRHFVSWIAVYGLNDATKVCNGLKKRLMSERKRRLNERKK